MDKEKNCIGGEVLNRIRLILPTADHETQIKEYINEHISNGEQELHGGALIEKMPYTKWLKQIKANANEATVNPEWVVSSTFFAMTNEKIIGMIDIRHLLNQMLREYGGHIGFGVRPSERSKGFATEILMEGLKHCNTIGLHEIMLACYKENAASSKTILKCGGVFEKEFLYADGKIVQVYWIKI